MMKGAEKKNCFTAKSSAKIQYENRRRVVKIFQVFLPQPLSLHYPFF